MPDMSPFANNQYTTPDFLKQDPKNTSATGAVSNMVKALMDGNNKFQARGGSLNGGTPNVGSATSYQAPGQPMSLAPPGAAAGPLAGAPPSAVAPSPFDTGAPPMNMAPAPGMMQTGIGAAAAGMPGMPNGIDPSLSALFSPIPGGRVG